MNNGQLGRAMVAVALAAAGVVGYALVSLFGSEPGGVRTDAGPAGLASRPPGQVPSLPETDAEIDLSGRVVDGAGNSIAGVQITARAESTAERRGVDAGVALVLDAAVVARTDRAGRFAMAGLGAGHVRLELEGPGVVTSEVRFVEVPRRDLEIVATREISIAGQVAGDDPPGIAVTAVGESTRVTATADDAGRFELGGLPEGVYRVFASAGERGSPAVRVERRGPGPFAPVTLALAPAAIIGGEVIDAETGDPIAARVVLTHSGDEPAREAETDDRGRFAVEGVPGGRWYAEASAPGYVGADSLAFSADHSRTLTLRLSRGGSLAGAVVDPDGSPIAGALVEAADSENPAAPRSLPAAPAGGGFIPRGELGVMTGPIPFPPPAPIAASRIARPVRTGSDGEAADRTGGSQRVTGSRGRFAIVGLEPGTYRLLASHPEWAGGSSEPVTIALGGNREGIEVAMTRGVRIRGVVRDPSGDPIAAAEITATGQGPMPLRTHTDTDGRFQLPPLAGATTLTARAPGFAATEREIARPTTEEIAIELSKADASIAGRVRDASGFPVRGARLSIQGEAVSAAVTDESGRFELGGLPKGTFEIAVAHPDYPPRRVKRATGSDRDIEVPLGGGLRGLVIDADSRRPMGARVTIRPAGDDGASGEAIATPDGRFERVPLAAGRYEVTASAPGYAPASVTAKVAPGSRPKQITTDDVQIELVRGADVSGTVRDENGERVAGAEVTAAGQTTTSDIDGRFELRDLPASGDVEIAAERGDRRGATTVTLAPGDELTTVGIRVEPR